MSWCLLQDDAPEGGGDSTLGRHGASLGNGSVAAVQSEGVMSTWKWLRTFVHACAIAVSALASVAELPKEKSQCQVASTCDSLVQMHAFLFMPPQDPQKRRWGVLVLLSHAAADCVTAIGTDPVPFCRI